MTVLLMVISLGTRKSWEEQGEHKHRRPASYYRACMAGVLSRGFNS